MASTEIVRNQPADFDIGYIHDTRINPSATMRRTATLGKRRSVKREWQAAWLLRAITCIDLTTLAGDDTASNVRRLAAKARQPIRSDILNTLEIDNNVIKVAAVCVYHARISDALEALKGSNIPVAAVSTGFPAGQSPYRQRIAEISESVALGAAEIDVVISREHVLAGNWQALYDEVREMRETCGHAHMKVILATGELGPIWNVAKASKVCMMAGADFIKTSTGKETVNATLDVSLIMIRMIREYFQRTNYRVGFKPAGGIRTAKQALEWLVLIKEELGDDWLHSNLFRFGASSLLTDIERQLSHFATGHYAAKHHMPMG